MKPSKLLIWVSFLMASLLSCPGKAGWERLPESRHHQFLTHALFTEEQTTFVIRDSSRVWAALAGSLALIENTDTPLKPQLVAFVSMNLSFRYKSSVLEYNVETFDGRFGLAVEMNLSDSARLSIGVLHLSGHAADSILDADLITPNVGQDALFARLIYDLNSQFRFGTTLRPLIGSDPVSNAFAADQFVEWYPFAYSGDQRTPRPYLALGLEEYGRHTVKLSFHAQLGVAFADHFLPKKVSNLRVVFGYYTGQDLRLKYAQFKENDSRFIYIGTMINF